MMPVQELDFKPGSLVELRGRPWIVLPSDDRDLLLLKPLGGTEREITGIYKPLGTGTDMPRPYSFIKPGPEDLKNDFASARLLYDASRLSFRNVSGPFRCLGKLSFRPRSYQMVPLIMALRQEVVRLFIADDVGIGKTIEALLIAKELHDRGEIRRFAIVCLPHLCDQWQDELKSKFGLEAVVIRSGTTLALERGIRNNETVFDAYPFQIISIDYIKSSQKRQVFVDHCPELVIVDEAHTCAQPEGAHMGKQLRHRLLRDLAGKADRHIVLLSATPHNGKDVEFKSLLGLLDSRYATLDIAQASESDRKSLAKHFVQRRRGDVLRWMGEDTAFPSREFNEQPFAIGREYAAIFNDVLEYARGQITESGADRRRQRYSYWDALALLRGVMSSPAAGAAMLVNKAHKKNIPLGEDDQELGSEEIDLLGQEQVMDRDEFQEDSMPFAAVQNVRSLRGEESGRLLEYARRLQDIGNPRQDKKVAMAIEQVKSLLDKGYHPIVFCRYIQTANYLGQILKDSVRRGEYRNVRVEVVTSELNDEQRRDKIRDLESAERRVLVATDCLSEGINLQNGFNAVIHYDLPWNPNRLEQREGRVDRFGQASPTVRVSLMYGENDPIDGVVLDVLLRKAREIRNALGISVPFPDNSESVMMAVTNALLLKPGASLQASSRQASLFDQEIADQQQVVAEAYRRAEERERQTRSIFAQHAIKAEEIEADLREVDESIGSVEDVERFVIGGIRHLGAQADQAGQAGKEYKIHTTNIPQRLRHLLGTGHEIRISFASPTPAGHQYIGRNHAFTEQLARHIINASVERLPNAAARASVIRSGSVDKKTTLLQLRVRNVIAEQPSGREIVTEEMWLWGYRSAVGDEEWLSHDAATRLFAEARGTGNLAIEEQRHWIEAELAWINDEDLFRQYTDPIALERAGCLVESHGRFRKLVKGSRYKVVEPILPMDVLGVYVFLPG